MRRRYRGRHRRRSLRSLTTALMVLALVGVTVPGAYGGYLATVTNTNNTAASAAYFTCTNAAQGPGAASTYFAYPFSDNAGVNAADISGNNRTGSYSTVLNAGVTPTGVTYGVNNGGVCPRDNRSVITLNGSSGFVAGPTAAIQGPNTFSIEVWFRTTVKQGKLIGFGNNRLAASGSYDRHIYINTSGNLVFGVYSNSVVKLVTSPVVVTDGAWHQAVATLGPSGMVLYLDGASTGTPDPNTKTGEPFSGYWRIGYDTLNTGWTGSGTNYYFNGQLAFAAAYSVVLTATQVAQRYRAGTA